MNSGYKPNIDGVFALRSILNTWEETISWAKTFGSRILKASVQRTESFLRAPVIGTHAGKPWCHSAHLLEGALDVDETAVWSQLNNIPYRRPCKEWVNASPLIVPLDTQTPLPEAWRKTIISSKERDTFYNLFTHLFDLVMTMVFRD
ncbi:hypothetical protein VNI00_019474 [Paramarasmius palmivorus]|uniref:Uncharacterized protein n=1 Tax=Paramarasmius palmivorus TaxID=297713 RepID=A0AAW0AMG5_9AGAR